MRIDNAKAAIHRADPSQFDAELLEAIKLGRKDATKGLGCIRSHTTALA